MTAKGCGFGYKRVHRMSFRYVVYSCHTRGVIIKDVYNWNRPDADIELSELPLKLILKSVLSATADCASLPASKIRW
jgi:hypothetical protein